MHWENLEMMKTEGIYPCNLYCIREICKCKQFNEEKMHKIIEQYKNYFNLSCEMLPNGDLIYDSHNEFWTAATYSNSMCDIAEIALYFLSLPATQ